MKAIILAAGKGSRLKKFTENKPKTLLEVGGKPILSYQLNALLENGITDIVIVLGFKGFMIKEYITNHEQYKNLNVTYIENDEYANSNSSYSWWLARDHIKDEETLIHFNSDLIFYPELIQRMISCNKENAVFIDKKISLTDSMENVVLDDWKMVEMDKRVIPGADGKAVGVAKFNRDAISFMLQRIKEFLDSGDKNQHFYGMIRKAIHKYDFEGIDLESSHFREVNTTDDYADAKNDSFGWGDVGKFVIMLFGSPATGKTTASRKIRDYFEREVAVDLLSTFRIRQDLGLTDLYSAEQRETVYKKTNEQFAAKLKLPGSCCIILDGNFNKKERRDGIRNESKKAGAFSIIVHVFVDDKDEIQKRMDERTKHTGILEHKAASVDLYDMIDSSTDNLTDDEKNQVIITYNSQTGNVSTNIPLDTLKSTEKQIVSGIIEALS